MPDGPAIIYRYDGSFDGFLTAVFDAWAGKRPVAAITSADGIQTGFGQVIERVDTAEEKARRVEKGVLSKLGGMALKMIWVCFWSGDFDKDTVLYRYIRAGFSLGRNIYNSLTHPDVLPAEYIYRNITREEQRVKGFVRFARMENGVFFARIQPKNSLVPIMMPHFADRYNDMPFLIHDAAHLVTGVYDGAGWYLVENQEVTPPDLDQSEPEYRKMWRRFYDAVAVDGRINPRQKRNMMPKFYWKNMPEMMPRYAPGVMWSEKAVARKVCADGDVAAVSALSPSEPISES